MIIQRTPMRPNHSPHIPLKPPHQRILRIKCTLVEHNQLLLLCACNEESLDRSEEVVFVEDPSAGVVCVSS